MNKKLETPEELEAARKQHTAALIRNLNEGATRDAPRIEKYKEELRKKHLEKKAAESSKSTGRKES